VLAAEAWEQAGAWGYEGGGGGDSDGAPVEYRRHNVAACWQGRGRLAPPGGAGYWVGGRLWEYDDGALGFAFVEGERTVIRFCRVQPGLMGSSCAAGL
jgi:hypothetical protein